MNLCKRTWQQLANSRKVFFSQKVCSLLSNLPSPSALPTVLKEQIQLSVQNIVLRIHTLLSPFETGLLFMLLARARCCKFCKFKSYPLFLSLPATENIELVIQLHFSGILICNFYLKHALGGSTVENVSAGSHSHQMALGAGGSSLDSCLALLLAYCDKSEGALLFRALDQEAIGWSPIYTAVQLSWASGSSSKGIGPDSLYGKGTKLYCVGTRIRIQHKPLWPGSSCSFCRMLFHLFVIY